MAFTVLQLIAYASTADGYSADFPLPLPIRVEDENDNHPIFTEAVYNFEVLESSRVGETTLKSKICCIKCLYALFERLRFYSYKLFWGNQILKEVRGLRQIKMGGL